MNPWARALPSVGVFGAGIALEKLNMAEAGNKCRWGRINILCMTLGSESQTIDNELIVISEGFAILHWG